MSRYVFNQYYFDLLKKLKTLSKGSGSGSGERATRSELVNGIIVRKAIKNKYSSYDKLSDEYSVYFADVTGNLKVPWSHGQQSDVATLCQDGLVWLQSDEVQSVELYKGITIGAADAVLKNRKSLLHYVVLFSLFSQQPAMTEESVSVLLSLLKNMKTVTDFTTFYEDLDKQVESEYTKACVRFLVSLQTSRKEAERTTTSTAILDDNPMMKDLESTSLGKLAKEIMSDIDVNDIHKSMGEEGDILKALSNPEGGMSKLLGTVSQKMIAKLASGEIRQETLLQDALQFSSKLKDMLPKEAQGLGDIGNMMSQMGNLSKMMSAMGSGGDKDTEGEGFDISKISELFGMNMNNGGGARKDSSRAMKAKQLRRKLEKRKASASASDAATAPPDTPF